MALDACRPKLCIALLRSRRRKTQHRFPARRPTRREATGLRRPQTLAYQLGLIGAYSDQAGLLVPRGGALPYGQLLFL